MQGGLINTEMNPGGRPSSRVPARRPALGRYGTVDDIAATVAYFASDEVRYVTGTAIMWVPRTRPPSSGDHPVLVDEAAQVIGSS